MKDKPVQLQRNRGYSTIANCTPNMDKQSKQKDKHIQDSATPCHSSHPVAPPYLPISKAYIPSLPAAVAAQQSYNHIHFLIRS